MKLSQSCYSASYDSGMWVNDDGNGGYNTGRQPELEWLLEANDSRYTF